MSETTNLGRVAMVPKGTWDNTATYSKLNVVTYGGSSYVALKAVPAGTAVSNTSYWQLIAEKGNTGGIAQMANTFSQTTAYAVGDYCTYNDDFYRFVAAHAAAGWDADEVTEITASAFDSSEAYSIGDYVSYNGSYYQFTSAHTAGDAWDYDEVSEITADAFIATGSYAIGDYVIYNSGLYQFTSAHYDGAWDDDLVTAVTAGDELLLRYLKTEVNDLLDEKADNDIIADEFSSSTAYAKGDYVIYNGVLYKFTAAHSAGAWTGSDASAVVVGDELDALNDDLDTLDNDLDLLDAKVDSIIQESVFDVTVDGDDFILTWTGAAGECPYTVSLSGEDYVLSFNY